MPDYFTVLTQQLAAAVEAMKGAPEALTAANVKFRLFGDAQYTPQYPRFANEEIGDDLAAAADFVAGRQAQIALGINYRSSGVLAGPHAIGVYLRGCGMREQTVKQINIGSITGGDGVFKAGQSYTATGSKTGVIDQDCPGSTAMRYVPVTGGDLVNLDVVTIGAESATASGASSTESIRYTPRSSGHESLTLQLGVKNSEGTAAKDQLFRLKGAMGSFSVDAAALDVFKFRATYSGVESLVDEGSFFTGYTLEGGTNVQLPKLIASVIQINGVTIKPDAFSFAQNQQVEMDPDVTTDTTNDSDGFFAARLGTREPTITVAPYRNLKAVLDDMGLWRDGTTFPFVLRCGTSPWQIELQAKKAQLRGGTLGQRAATQTNQMQIVCTRGDNVDDDFALYFR